MKVTLFVQSYASFRTKSPGLSLL